MILSGNLTIANSMIMDELTADEAEFEIYDLNSLVNWNSVAYGTPLVYSHDGSVIGKFYVVDVNQRASNIWKISAVSAVGLLVYQEHNGGVYSVSNGDTVKSVIDEIMAGLNISYTVSNAVKNQYVAGHLPAANCRDNLQQLCFAFGISIMKDANGNLIFDYNQPTTPEAVLQSSSIYTGGTKQKVMPISKAKVHEHAFYPVTSRTPVIVFDNTSDVTAVNQKIIFDNPVIVSTITTTGTITISAANANYAIVSGVGTISVVEYTHTIKVLEEDTGVTTVENKELVYRDATLVNVLNSENCLKRVADYYSKANEVDYDIVATTERAGELLRYPDPFTNESKTGLVKQMDITVSKILKSATKLTENWLPNHLGNNYTDYELITSGNTWTATKTGMVRIVLIGGGNGGAGGAKGGDGAISSGGAGGAAGAAGYGGNIYSFDINVVQGQTYSISIGAGGAGGAANSGAGGAGGATTITINGVTYSSANGQPNAGGVINQFTGDVYALPGGAGVAGGNGGRGGSSTASTDTATGVAGDAVTYNGVTYNGGGGGTYSYKEASWGTGFKGGGGGGGAAVGNNGGNGQNGDLYKYAHYQQGGYVYYWEAQYGQGGGGASADARSSATLLGGGGDGGHGGGGAGGTAVSSGVYTDWGRGLASGGNGGAGGAGAAGGMLIYK